VSTPPTNSQPSQRNKRSRPPILPSTIPDSSMQGGLTKHNFSIKLLYPCWFDSNLFILCGSGVRKSPVDSAPFSYREHQHGRDIYPSAKFNSTAAGFLGFGGNCSASNKSIYWSSRTENSTESFSPVALKESGEKRQGTANGCRLFGIQLLDNCNGEESLPMVTLSGRVGDDGPLPSLDAESDQHSEPSNINRSDFPSLSCDAEKSCLRSPQESQSRQIRSCTKVVLFICVGVAIIF